MTISDLQEDLKIVGYLNKVTNSNGYVLYRELRKIQSSYSIYRENKYSLNKEIETFNNELGDIENYNDSPVARNRKQRKIIKDIHNLISSAQSFVEYHNKKEELASGNILFVLFRELRNMTLHVNSFQLTSIRQTSIVNNSDINVFQSMNKKSFKEFLNNKIRGHRIIEVIEYLDNLEDKFDFEKELNSYCLIIDNLYYSIIKDFLIIKKLELNEFVKNVEQIHQRMINPIDKVELRLLKYQLSKF